TIGNLLTQAFNNEGYETYYANTAAKALSILEHVNIFIFFLDLKLPDISGIELCRKIKKLNPVAYIFAITGYAETYDLKEARAAGFDNYFIKPFHIKDLVQVANVSLRDLERWHTILTKVRKNDDDILY
ncbi:MAG: response regulator, partial [Candidatus Neomarinimicrobiota bacterium]